MLQINGFPISSTCNSRPELLILPGSVTNKKCPINEYCNYNKDETKRMDLEELFNRGHSLGHCASSYSSTYSPTT